MTHDTQETEEDKRFAQEFEALHEGRTLGYRLLMNRGEREREDGDDTDDRIDGEEHFPSQTHVRDSFGGAPHSDIGSEERGDRLDELTESQSRGQVARDDIRYQRVE